MRSKFGSRLKIHRRLFHIASDEEHQNGGRDAKQEQGAPGGRGRQERKEDGVENRCHSPSNGPTALHHTERFSAMFGADGFAQQNSPRSPLAAEAES